MFPVRPAICCVRMLPISLCCIKIAFQIELAGLALAMSQTKAWFLRWWANVHRLPRQWGHLQGGRWCCLAGDLKDCFLWQQRWQTRDCHCFTLFSMYNTWGKAASLLFCSCSFFCALVQPRNLTLLQHNILFISSELIKIPFLCLRKCTNFS